MIDYEDLRIKIKDRLEIHDLVDLLNITEDDILDEFKDKVIESIEEIYVAIDYGMDEGDETEIEQ